MQNINYSKCPLKKRPILVMESNTETISNMESLPVTGNYFSIYLIILKVLKFQKKKETNNTKNTIYI